MRIITTELIMSTRPCDSYPRERVEALLAQHGPIESWEAMAVAARRAGWPVPLADLRLTAYRAASPSTRQRGVQHSTRLRVEAHVMVWPAPPPVVEGVRDRLLAWATSPHTSGESIDDIEAAARQVRTATPYATAAAHALHDITTKTAKAVRAQVYAADAAADAADNVALHAEYDADARSPVRWETLLHICRLLDEEAP